MASNFCPTCSNVLLVANAGSSGFRFFCQTCPYVHNINKMIAKKVPLKRKAVDDVMGGEEEWKNAPQTDAVCAKCSHRKAYFFQVQTRSADEPMTNFFKCVGCGNRWKE